MGPAGAMGHGTYLSDKGMFCSALIPRMPFFFTFENALFLVRYKYLSKNNARLGRLVIMLSPVCLYSRIHNGCHLMVYIAYGIRNF